MKRIVLTSATLALALSTAACSDDAGTTDSDTDSTTSDSDTDGTDTEGGDTVSVSGELSGDTTWTADKLYILEDIVTFSGGTLTIEPGTEIRGLNGSALVIEKDAMLMAAGTADAPIVFTSNNIGNSPARGDWGGLVLLGTATTNIGTGQAEGFPVPPTYGGEDDSHNCGTLQYVRVEYAGFAISDGNELNGITFYACGSATTVDHVQSHMGLDDGIEMFGGTFNAQYIVVTGAADDSIDTDQGYRGLLDFVFVHQDPNVGDNCFEISNQGSDFAAEPKTAPDFCNATCVGSGQSGEKSKGLTVKEGTYGFWSSSIFTNATNEATLLADDATADEALADNINLLGNIFVGNLGSPEHASESMTVDQAAWQAWIEDPERGNSANDPGLGSAEWGAPNIAPSNDVSEIAGPCEYGFIGAVDPNGEDWTQASWINYTP